MSQHETCVFEYVGALFELSRKTVLENDLLKGVGTVIMSVGWVHVFQSYYLFLMGNWLLEKGLWGEKRWWILSVLARKCCGPPAPLCCEACALSLAWLESLHLMVYSYSAVQDAVPSSSSHTQYVCEEVTGTRSESHFGSGAVWNASAPILKQPLFLKSANARGFHICLPKVQMFYSCQTKWVVYGSLWLDLLLFNSI